MDEALVQDDCIDLIVAELDRCREVTKDQDKVSKIENALYETQRNVVLRRTEKSSTFNSWITRW